MLPLRSNKIVFVADSKEVETHEKIKNPADHAPKVITLDGPAGSGKSTVAQIIAQELGWIYVNTGSLYRTLALMFKESGAGTHDKSAIERFVAFLSERYRQDFRSGRVYLGEREVSHEIRTPAISEMASIVAQDELVRKRLFPIQRRIVFDCNGAIVDGRDMGTVVFPDSPLKIFLTASPERRAHRRSEELRLQGKSVDYDELVREIYERDRRDSTRILSPMKPADDALILDCTEMNPQTVVKTVLRHALDRGLVPKFGD